MTENGSGVHRVEVAGCFLRLATPADVPHIVSLIRGLADYEKLLEKCQATEDNIHTSLFASKREPYDGPIAVVLEVTNKRDDAWGSTAEAGAEPVVEEWQAIAPQQAKGGEGEDVATGQSPNTLIVDDEANQYTSAYNPWRTVVAFVVVFPSFSTFCGCHNLFVEDLYVRLPYRSLGLGTILLKYVCRVAVKKGMSRVDWQVINWNQPAIQFYTKKIGAHITDRLPVRLDGDALREAGKEEQREQ